MSQGVDLSSPERAIPAPVGFASFASPVSVRCLRKAREHGVCEKLGDTPSARARGHAICGKLGAEQLAANPMKRMVGDWCHRTQSEDC
jgi:hypothetical protein